MNRCPSAACALRAFGLRFNLPFYHTFTRSRTDEPGTMRPGLTLRWPLVLALLLAPSCAAPPSIPAPWEATEPQSAEPASTLPDTSSAVDWTRIGYSIRGKPIVATDVGGGGRRIYIIGSIHGDEPECAPVAAHIAELLSASPGLDHSTVRIVCDMNPDGTAAKTRTNTRKVDLERNWPAKDFQKASGGSGDRPCSELETAAVHADILKFNPDIIIIFQSANLSPTVTYQGAGRMLAYEFTSGARRADPHWRFNPEQRIRVQGSLESLFGSDLGKTVLRVEFQRKVPAETNAAAMVAGLRALDAQPATAAPGPVAAKTAPGRK